MPQAPAPPAWTPRGGECWPWPRRCDRSNPASTTARSPATGQATPGCFDLTAQSRHDRSCAGLLQDADGRARRRRPNPQGGRAFSQGAAPGHLGRRHRSSLSSVMSGSLPTPGNDLAPETMEWKHGGGGDRAAEVEQAGQGAAGGESAQAVLTSATSLVTESFASPNSITVLWLVVELVLDPGEARVHAALQHDDVAAPCRRRGSACRRSGCSGPRARPGW